MNRDGNKNTDGTHGNRNTGNIQYTSGRRYREQNREVPPSKKGTPRDKSLVTRRESAVRTYVGEHEVEYVVGKPDWIFGTVVLILVSLGILMVYSASYPTAVANYNDGFFYAKKQLLFALLGIGAMIAASCIHTNFYKKLSPVFYVIGVLALIAVLLVGTDSHGAKRWVSVAGVNIQPSEFAKLTLVFFLAWYVNKFKDRYGVGESKKNRFVYGVVLPLVIIGLYAGLVMLENHLSGTIIMVTLGIITLFIAGAPVKLNALTYFSLGLPTVIAYIIYNPYALDRVYTFLNKENADILGERWQTYQGILAIGSGGFMGLGFGQSRQKFSYVSEAQNDFVFTIWCEEMGFFGAMVVIGLFAFLIIRGFHIAMKATDVFSSVLVFGIMTQVAIQVILNLMVVTDIVPNTGISLPFMSSGGSSLFMLMGEMGIVMSVSKRSYQKKL